LVKSCDYCQGVELPRASPRVLRASRHAVAKKGDEDTLNFWWLRETQALVVWVREPEQKLMDGAKLARWSVGRSRGPWWDLLREAVEQYVADTSGAELPAPHFVEWLAEWGRELRRRQRDRQKPAAHGGQQLRACAMRVKTPRQPARLRARFPVQRSGPDRRLRCSWAPGCARGSARECRQSGRAQFP